MIRHSLTLSFVWLVAHGCSAATPDVGPAPAAGPAPPASAPASRGEGQAQTPGESHAASTTPSATPSAVPSPAATSTQPAPANPPPPDAAPTAKAGSRTKYSCASKKGTCSSGGRCDNTDSLTPLWIDQDATGCGSASTGAVCCVGCQKTAASPAKCCAETFSAIPVCIDGKIGCRSDQTPAGKDGKCPFER